MPAHPRSGQEGLVADLRLDSLCVALDYAAPFDALMLQFKGVPRPGLAGLMAAALVRAHHAMHGDACHVAGVLVVPVPSSRASLRRRGFNPAGEVARHFAWRQGWPLRLGGLVRTREHSQQHFADRRSRLHNTQALYRADAQVCGRVIMLVDDVVTTGSTLRSAAQALYQAGAVAVHGHAVARTPVLALP
ncbi:MAG: phosphoribosyltransferase family protein [Corticimicrobacter sp.]|uniref:ComF family protein n=1 Tax=Corticimicrobacter sp. TaxID=2678536 RepID=UPI0032DA2E72